MILKKKNHENNRKLFLKDSFQWFAFYILPSLIKSHKEILVDSYLWRPSFIWIRWRMWMVLYIWYWWIWHKQRFPFISVITLEFAKTSQPCWCQTFDNIKINRKPHPHTPGWITKQVIVLNSKKCKPSCLFISWAAKWASFFVSVR